MTDVKEPNGVDRDVYPCTNLGYLPAVGSNASDTTYYSVLKQLCPEFETYKDTHEDFDCVAVIIDLERENYIIVNVQVVYDFKFCCFGKTQSDNYMSSEHRLDERKAAGKRLGLFITEASKIVDDAWWCLLSK